jgi:hypothetical protein
VHWFLISAAASSRGANCFQSDPVPAHVLISSPLGKPQIFATAVNSEMLGLLRTGWRKPGKVAELASQVKDLFL